MNEPEQPSLQGSQADIYERYLLPGMRFDTWAVDLLRAVSFQPGEQLLDVACGTGIVARTAAQQSGTGRNLIGLDLNSGMLAMAQTQEPSVTWREGNAMELPFDSHTFDVVVCQQGLQFMPDRLQVLREIYRVLVPGGRVGLNVWCGLDDNPGPAAVVEALGRRVGPEAETVAASSFALGDADELERLTVEAGFSDVRVERRGKTSDFVSPDLYTRIFLGGGALARAGIMLTEDAMTAVLDDARTELQKYMKEEGLAFPVVTHVVTAYT